MRERPHPSAETVDAVARHLVTDDDGHDHLGDLPPDERLATRQVALDILLAAYPHFRRDVLRAARDGCSDPLVCFYLDELLRDGMG